MKSNNAGSGKKIHDQKLRVMSFYAGNSFLKQLSSGLRQHGLSLVELMVALAIGTLIALAISTLFFQVFSGSGTADDTARASEAGSFGLRILSEDFRMAGFVGLIDDGSKIDLVRSSLVSGAATDNCGNPKWFLPLNEATNRIVYIEHFTNPSDLPCIAAANHVAGSPAIVLRGASGTQARPADFATNKMFLQSNQAGGIVFQGADYAGNVKGAGRHTRICRYTPGAGACADTADEPPCRCPTTGVNAGKGSVALVDAPIFAYHTNVYYIRPCSRPAGATCTAADDNGQPIPTLVRRQLSENTDPATFVEVPIAEGVERMSVSYGIDTNLDGVPDFFTNNKTIFTPTSPNLSDAITIRISLLMRTRKPENNYDDSVNTYTLADDDPTDPTDSFNCGPPGPPTSPLCRYHRYILTDTVQVKNNAFRR